ncbi:MAG: hypothetical protein Q7K16_01355 [Candidatus Azambacteria bacterium]|nr:hypothetical protein [Candidatus Azambacteria bacterium]
MKKFLTKNMSVRDISRRDKKFICLIFIVAIVFNFMFLPLTALAGDLDIIEKGLNVFNPLTHIPNPVTWFASKALLEASSVISAILGAVFGLILYFEAIIIDYILSPTNFSFTNSPIVTLGWGITRDLANMFFILILLIIAFATVLRIQSYALKQLLWKVVVAALLINFSLVIAGFVIDFTQVLTQFFLKQITGGGGFITITTKLANSMQILNFYNPALPKDDFGGAAQFGAASVAATVGIILTLIGLVITVFVFGAAMIFLIVRILHLWLLLIFAPIVWMLWILPATSGQFSKWWNDFIKWAFFAPIFVFMIYLSLSIFDATGKLNPKVFGIFPNAWQTPAPGLTTIGMPAAIFQWILVIAMMFGSLIVAQKFGVMGAAASSKMLTGWGDKSKNWAGRQLRSRALGVGAKEAGPGVEARQGLLVRGAQKLAAMPGGRLLAGQVFKMTTAEAGTVEAAQKQFANWTPEAIQAYLQKSPGLISSSFIQNQQMGAALALKEKGKLDKIDPDTARAEARIKELVSLASRYSPKNVDKLLEVAPHMATEFNKKIKDIVVKIEKADQIMLSSLADPEVVLNLNPNQLKDIAQKSDDTRVQKVKDVVDSEFRGLAAVTQGSISAILADSNKDRRNKKLNNFTETEFNNRVSSGMPVNQARDEAKKLEKIARGKATIESPAWTI